MIKSIIVKQDLAVRVSVKSVKLQPAIFPLCKRIIRFHELPAETIQCFSQYGLYIIDSLNSIEHCVKESST